MLYRYLSSSHKERGRKVDDNWLERLQCSCARRGLENEGSVNEGAIVDGGDDSLRILYRSDMDAF